jgi:branched-chain amino acid transport system substrate-binding protein
MLAAIAFMALYPDGILADPATRGMLRKLRQAISLLVLGVASALVAVGCCGGGDSGSGGGGTETVKIVSDLPRQGANRAQITTMVNAIQLAQ